MSDVNKIVAAILTVGRLPTIESERQIPNMDDMLDQYDDWLDRLSKRDAEQDASDRATRTAKNKPLWE